GPRNNRPGPPPARPPGTRPRRSPTMVSPRWLRRFTAPPRLARREPRWCGLRRPGLERLEDRTLLNGHTLATATLLSFGPDHLALASGSLPTSDFFEVTVTAPALLTVAVQDAGATSRLSLRGADGGLLVQSDGSPGNPGGQIAQHVDPGTYFLEVDGLGG